MLNNMEKCTVLARAMFPTAVIEPSSGNGVNIRIYDKPNETRSWYDFSPYESAEDSRALVLWLAEDNKRWYRYFIVLEKLVDTPRERMEQLHPQGLFYAILRSFVTAPLPVIADAAWQAIQEK